MEAASLGSFQCFQAQWVMESSPLSHRSQSQKDQSPGSVKATSPLWQSRSLTILQVSCDSPFARRGGSWRGVTVKSALGFNLDLYFLSRFKSWKFINRLKIFKLLLWETNCKLGCHIKCEARGDISQWMDLEKRYECLVLLFLIPASFFSFSILRGVF